MSGLHHDLEHVASSIAGSSFDEWNTDWSHMLAATPLSTEQPEPVATLLDERLESLVRHAIRTGASQLHLAAKTAPAGRFGERLRTFSGLEPYGALAVETMVASALDPSTSRRLERVGATTRTLFIAALGQMKIEVWYSRDGLRTIIHLNRDHAPTRNRLSTGVARVVSSFRRIL